MKVKIKTLTLVATIALLSLLISNLSFSQATESEQKNKEGRGYLMFGGGKLDIDALNDRLLSQGKPVFNDEFASFGIGFLNKKNQHWLIGAEGHYLIIDEKDYAATNGNYKASLSAACGFIDFGYDVLSSTKLNLYPLIGIGGGGLWLQIGKNNFNDILDTPERNANLTSFTALFNFALGSDYMIKSSEDTKNKVGLVLGFRAGYIYSPWKGTWWTDNISIDNGPKLGMTGPYLRLMIGIGGKGEWWKEKEK